MALHETVRVIGTPANWAHASELGRDWGQDRGLEARQGTEENASGLGKDAGGIQASGVEVDRDWDDDRRAQIKDSSIFGSSGGGACALGLFLVVCLRTGTSEEDATGKASRACVCSQARRAQPRARGRRFCLSVPDLPTGSRSWREACRAALVGPATGLVRQ